METNQQAERPQVEIYPCSECDTEYDAEHLFVPDMRVIARMQGEEEGKKIAFVTPEDLPGWAVCEACRFSEETYTLASSLASARSYQQRRMGRSQSLVTVAEADELINCCLCEEQGEKTMVRRQQARAPGWVGCNILKGRRLQLVNPNERALAYVTSHDLLKPGTNGFVLCPRHMAAEIPELREDARRLGLSEYTITRRIRSQSLMDMINGVRRKETRQSRNS